MATLNRKIRRNVRTHEGAPAAHINYEQQLRRSLMSCLLWEKEFYEDGQTIADRLCNLVPKVKPEIVASMMIEARKQMHLRHAPLLIATELARHGNLKADDLDAIILRADELTEFLAVYWRDGKCKLANQVKKGLAKAFTKFGPYSLAKYNRDTAVKLRDVLFLCHAKPKNKVQELSWKKLIDGTMTPPDTWEVSLSGKGTDKKSKWERLLEENKLGGMALLRNLRNMQDEGIDKSLLKEALKYMKTDRILPFRFIAAANYAPGLESAIEGAMLKSLAEQPKFEGHTVVLVDVSGSMEWDLSTRSEMKRIDVACGVAICCREMCEDISIFSFSIDCREIPARHGFALRDAIWRSQSHTGTYLGKAVAAIDKKLKYDRLIVITDEQSHDTVPAPKGRGYMLNIASAKNGVGFGKWARISGWSDNVLRYIAELESCS